jgi:predicted transcriptional regulator
MSHNIDALIESQRIAAIHAAIAQGEQDIKAGRFTRYTPELMNDIIQKVLSKDGSAPSFLQS